MSTPVMLDAIPSSTGHVQTGRLRALAVTTVTRLDVVPDLAPMGDFVPGYEVSGMAGIGAPKGTPNEIIAMLNREINAGVTDPKVSARFAELGTMVLVGSPGDFGKVIARGNREVWQGDPSGQHQAGVMARAIRPRPVVP